MVIGWGEFNTFVIVSCRAWASTAGMSFVFNFSSFLIGLIIYAAFRYCDPIKDGVIFSKDQVIRYHSYSQVHPLNCTKAIKCDESAWLLVSVNWERIVRKTCRRWTLRGIMPTLRLIFRMAPVVGRKNNILFGLCMQTTEKLFLPPDLIQFNSNLMANGIKL